MIYLSGVPDRALRGLPEFGYMMTPLMGSAPHWTFGIPWAADTGCYKRPESFQMEKYFAWLQKRDLRNLIFATAPDRLGDWRVTLDASLPVLSAMAMLSIPSALVAQDGLTPGDTPWEFFGCLFIGGTGGRGGWKESRHAEKLAQEAKRRGKWLHMGRVNSRRREDIAMDWHCDSVDGTYLASAPNILRPKLIGRIKWQHDQKRLFS